MSELYLIMEVDPSIVGVVLFKSSTPDQKLLPLSTLYCCSTVALLLKLPPSRGETAQATSGCQIGTGGVAALFAKGPGTFYCLEPGVYPVS